MSNIITGLAIRTARQALHMSQEELGQLLGVSQSTISNIESGFDAPEELIHGIEQILGMSGSSGRSGSRRSGSSRSSRNSTGRSGAGRSSAGRNSSPTYQNTTNINIKVASDNNNQGEQKNQRKTVGTESGQTEGQNDSTPEETAKKPAKKPDKTELPEDLDQRRAALIKQFRKNINSLNKMEEDEFREFLKSLNVLERYMIEAENPSKAVKVLLRDI